MADNETLSSIQKMAEELRENAKADDRRAAAARRLGERQTDLLGSVNLGIMEQFKIAQADQKRTKADKLDKLERLREAKNADEAKVAARASIGQNLEEPSFLNRMFKLALGIFGAAVFIKIVKNFDQVKAFTNDKLIPALKSTFTFLKDTLTPVFDYVVNNFEDVIKGVMIAAGIIIASKVGIKIVNAVKNIYVAYNVMKTMTLGIFRNLLLVGSSVKSFFTAMLTSKPVVVAYNALTTGFKAFKTFMMTKFVPTIMTFLKEAAGKAMSLLMGGFKKLILGVKAFRLFMMTTFIPSMISGFATMVTAMISTLAGYLAALTPMLIVAAPFIAIGLAIVAVFAGLTFMLTKFRDALGFGSIFDVLMLGVMHLKDAFGHIVNLVGSYVNFILGLVEKFGKFLGFEVDLPEIPKMDTDSAQKFKEQKQLEQREKVSAEIREDAAKRVIGKDEQFRGLSGEELAQLEKREQEGKFITRSEQRKLDAFQERRDRVEARLRTERGLEPPQGAGGANVANAVVNAPVSTTNVNNATTVMDAEPAIDGLDRFAMGGAF